LAACRSLAREVSVDRISFHTPWPAEETSKVLGAADVLILPTRGSQSLVSMPSKLISYMLAARPIIALSLPQTDLAEVVEQSGCGWIVEPDRPDLLATKIKEAMASGPATLVQRGRAGREFALQQFTREECLPRVIEIVEKAAHHSLD
jgi:colanic acid biosynthesis glycosyl transferase WcaI